MPAAEALDFAMWEQEMRGNLEPARSLLDYTQEERDELRERYRPDDEFDDGYPWFPR